MDRVSEPELIAAVAAAPDEDAPRLVYADWLIERGDPLGELIALQCALARADAADEVMDGEQQAIERERALRKLHEDRWFGVLRAIVEAGWVMRRGFVEHMTAWRARDFVNHAEAVVGRAPLLRSLAIGGEVVLASVPELARITCLKLEEAGPLDAATFHPFVAGQLPRLRRLEMANVTRDRESAQAIVELPVELEHLGYGARRVVGGEPTKKDAIPWVLRAIAGRQAGLRSLAVGRCYGLALDGLDELARLETLAVDECAIGAHVGEISRAVPGLTSLAIERDQIAADELGRVVRGLPGLRRLRLRYVGLGDEHAEAIAANAPATLRRLDVAFNHLGDDGARALLGLRERLVRLDLDHNPNVKPALVAEARHEPRLTYRPELPGVPQDILADLARGNKIGAIKRYREITSLGLANALHAIERISDERS